MFLLRHKEPVPEPTNPTHSHGHSDKPARDRVQPDPGSDLHILLFLDPERPEVHHPNPKDPQPVLRPNL